jgi:hypothetical protein
MKKSIQTAPQAWVAKTKNRLKIYDDKKVYLNKNDEFEIELFNPTQDPVLAKIYLNDNSISTSGLIVNPGQRIFLDRYLDENRKFMFSTYEVENSEEVKQAIANNGKLEVKFHALKLKTINITSNLGNIYTNGYPNSFPPTYTHDITYYNSDVNCSDRSFAQTSASSPISKMSATKSRSRSTIETGRVEKGSNSEQKFITSDLEFEYLSFHSVEYQILPFSVKTENDIRAYCTECGTRKRKSSWKFCPSCGTNY